METAWIFALGTELTLGQTVDSNSAWLARELAGIGVRTTRHLTLADELEPIVAALRAAADEADLLLITGGLGPTEDDLTRAALAEVAGEPLVLDEDSAAQIAAFFAERGREMPARNRCQAERPASARPLPNSCGTAPGVGLEIDGVPCYAMPGVPFEMRRMFADHVRPELLARTRGEVLRFDRLQTFGAGESDIGVAIADLMQRGRNPEVGTTAGLGVVGVRVNTRASSGEEARRLADETIAEIRQRLGSIVFGTQDETLAQVVGELLRQRGRTLSVAESCTGGLVAKELTDVSGSSAYFPGGAVAYANAVKTALLDVPADLIAQHGAVSGPVAEAMAAGAQRRFGSDYALSLTGVAGPTGGSTEKPVGLVFIGLAGPAGTRAIERRFGASSPRDVIRRRAANTALDWLRRALVAPDEAPYV